MIRKILLLCISLIVSLCILEFCFYILAKINYLPIKIPSFSLENVSKWSRFWLDINPDFGVWHKPYSEYRHIKSCFNVKYHTNSYGARDNERSLNTKGTKGVIVLGDSFIEGYGVHHEKRLTNLLEDTTNIEHLNFGSAGYFGPTQYYLMYKTLAKRFAHHAVIIGLLPFNDFYDDDYTHGQTFHRDRYRPYFVGEYPNYQLIYYRENLSESKFYPKPLSGTGYLKVLLSEFTFTYNTFVYFRKISMYRTATRNNKDETSTSNYGYYNFTEKQFNLMKFSLENLIREAEGKEVAIITMPFLRDLQQYSLLQGEPPLSKKLRMFAEQYGVTYVDLLPYMHGFTKNWSEYYLPCDGHWNEYGHFVASRYLVDTLPIYNSKSVSEIRGTPR